MVPAIRSEFRKLLTVRSTYVMLGFCLAVIAVIGFYALGIKASTASPEGVGLTKLADGTILIAQLLGLFIPITGILLVTHEYRYNTIMYSLTASRNRTDVLLAKALVVTTFSVFVALLTCILVPLLIRAGLHISNIELVAQNFPVGEIVSKVVLYIWGSSMLAFVIAMVIRSQVASIVGYLLLPTFGEQLLSLILKDNAKYLPFNNLAQLFIQNQPYSTTVYVLLAYIVGGIVLAGILFRQRDAT